MLYLVFYMWTKQSLIRNKILEMWEVTIVLPLFKREELNINNGRTLPELSILAKLFM